MVQSACGCTWGMCQITSIPFYKWCPGQHGWGALPLHLLLAMRPECKLTDVSGNPFATKPVALTLSFTALWCWWIWELVLLHCVANERYNHHMSLAWAFILMRARIKCYLFNDCAAPAVACESPIFIKAQAEHHDKHISCPCQVRRFLQDSLQLQSWRSCWWGGSSSTAASVPVLLIIMLDTASRSPATCTAILIINTTFTSTYLTQEYTVLRRRHDGHSFRGPCPSAGSELSLSWLRMEACVHCMLVDTR